ncbi:MAG: hypothetical protein M3024_16685 [Candidatus Dormibacteraeota bacterium]|nr:hypothetical protein [Candidatus Dormibacteraeota bacterium]
MALVLVGGPDAAPALAAMRAAGVPAEAAEGAEGLRRRDLRGERYTLVHAGPDDGEPEGSYARAHHRVALAEVTALAERLRPRERPLVRVVAFAYKRGLPEAATWVVDARFLDNPYWQEALRPLSGLDPEVREFVLGQPAAAELLDRLEALFAWVLPRYQRQELMLAFGCTGGRHRSVVLARELATRLQRLEGLDVEFSARDLELAAG